MASTPLETRPGVNWRSACSSDATTVMTNICGCLNITRVLLSSTPSAPPPRFHMLMLFRLIWWLFPSLTLNDKYRFVVDQISFSNLQSLFVTLFGMVQKRTTDLSC